MDRWCVRIRIGDAYFSAIEGWMVDLLTRMLAVSSVAVIVSVLIISLLIQKWAWAGYPSFPIILAAGLAIVVPAIFTVLATYFYW